MPLRTFRAGNRASDALPRDPSRQQRRLAALATKFSPAQLGAAARAYFEQLFSLAGNGEEARQARIEIYGAMSDPNFSPAEAVAAALERRVGDADPGSARSSPAQLEDDEDDDFDDDDDFDEGDESDLTEAERAAAVKKAFAEGAAAENERLLAIVSSPRVRGQERLALDLALKAPDMSAAAVINFIASFAVPQFPTIAERLGSAGIGLCFGGPMPDGVPSGSADAVIERINKRNGFGDSNEKQAAGDATNGAAKPRYRVAAPSNELPPGGSDDKPRF